MFISNVIDEQPANIPIGALEIGPGGGGPPAPGAAPPPPPPAHNGKAYWLKVSAQQDGTFSVTNQRNNFTKTYRVVTGTN